MTAERKLGLGLGRRGNWQRVGRPGSCCSAITHAGALPLPAAPAAPFPGPAQSVSPSEGVGLRTPLQARLSGPGPRAASFIRIWLGQTGSSESQIVNNREARDTSKLPPVESSRSCLRVLVGAASLEQPVLPWGGAATRLTPGCVQRLPEVSWRTHHGTGPASSRHSECSSSSNRSPPISLLGAAWRSDELLPPLHHGWGGWRGLGRRTVPRAGSSSLALRPWSSPGPRPRCSRSRWVSFLKLSHIFLFSQICDHSSHCPSWCNSQSRTSPRQEMAHNPGHSPLVCLADGPVAHRPQPASRAARPALPAAASHSGSAPSWIQKPQ